jgi:hypothetical protein
MSTQKNNKILITVALVLAGILGLYAYGFLPKIPEPDKNLPGEEVISIVVPVRVEEPKEVQEIKVSHHHNSFTLICKLVGLSTDTESKTVEVTCEKNAKKYVFPQDDSRVVFLPEKRK